MIVLMKCLDEEFAVPRCVGDLHDEPWVDRIVVIDGGSTDMTVFELKQFSKVEVFVHPWFDWYHDMEVSQSNIALSYVPHGKLLFILDFDERISPELRVKLAEIDKSGLPDGADIGHVARQTFEVHRHQDSPHAIIGEDGWPVISHQIGQFPDYQCRLIVRQPEHHWINSPHHVLSGFVKNVNLIEHVVHYQKDDMRCRDRIEKKWARCQARRKELGLVPDKFECGVPKHLTRFADPETWKGVP